MDNKRSVLVAVIKDRRDLGMLLKKHVYRMPVLYAPKKKADHIAFYQPSGFGRSGSCIRYYARLKGSGIAKRDQILPDEKDHPRSQEDYYLVRLGAIKSFKGPIRNRSRMRVSFGFTSLGKLLAAKDVLELFDIPPMEEMVFNALNAKGIKTFSQYGFSLANKKRYRMDFAIFCKNGPLNIECDGNKWHSIKAQRIKDKKRDTMLKKCGWTILRLKEKEIVEDMNSCIKKIKKAIQGLNGMIK
jgi:very-short-patch-repair endonuclease